MLAFELIYSKTDLKESYSKKLIKEISVNADEKASFSSAFLSFSSLILLISVTSLKNELTFTNSFFSCSHISVPSMSILIPSLLIKL